MKQNLTFRGKDAFMSEFHQERYQSLIDADRTEDWDIYRQSLFYIISGNPVLFDRRDKIYDFEHHCLGSNVLRKTRELASGEIILLKLAINLYNGNGFRNMDPWYIMIHLDLEMRYLALNSLRLRFHI